MGYLRTVFSSLLLAAALSPVPVAADSRGDGDDLLGLPAPPILLDHWINSERLEIPNLAGRVVLLRWWTDTCPFCSTTAPVLRELDQTYGDRGLLVIGIFHPKPAGDPDLERMRRATSQFEFTFPVALDADWTALRRWWLDRRPRGWTSVSFLLDRDGTIRYVHPGGEFHPGSGGNHWPDHQTCNGEYDRLVGLIEELLPPDP